MQTLSHSLFLNRDQKLRLGNCDSSAQSSTMNSTISFENSQKITDKFRTYLSEKYSFTPKKKQKNRRMQKTVHQISDSSNAIAAILSVISKQPTDSSSKKRQMNAEELQGVKASRRNRFKKAKDPMLFIQHYIKNEGFKPNKDEQFLLDSLVKLKQHIQTVQPMNLQFTLHRMYKTMNFCVDTNQTHYFLLIVMLAATICYEMKDLARATHFYIQSVICLLSKSKAGTYMKLYRIKVSSLTQIGLICLELNEEERAIIIFKKALQYAWKIRDNDFELRIYDLIGQAYYSLGNIKQASYYHERSVQSQVENPKSAMRVISGEMIDEFEKSNRHAENKDLTELFIEYLDLPIYNFKQLDPLQVGSVYPNYKDSASPRKRRVNRSYEFHDFAPPLRQIQKMLKHCEEFETELPNPDVHLNFVAEHKYGKTTKKHQTVFEHSSDYHRIFGAPAKIVDQVAHKLPLDKQIDKVLSEETNPHWWEEIILRTKKERQQKLGSLRNKIWNSHKSRHKYPQERKKSHSLKCQRIKEEINGALLNWIDPEK